MKLVLVTSRGSTFGEHAKSLLIRLSREVEDLDYEIVEVDRGDEPVMLRGKQLPCFLVGDKVVMEGKPNYERLKKIVSKPAGKSFMSKIFGKK